MASERELLFDLPGNYLPQTVMGSLSILFFFCFFFGGHPFLEVPLCTIHAWMRDHWYLCFGFGADPVAFVTPYCGGSLKALRNFGGGTIERRLGILSTSFSALLIHSSSRGQKFI